MTLKEYRKQDYHCSAQHVKDNVQYYQGYEDDRNKQIARYPNYHVVSRCAFRRFLGIKITTIDTCTHHDIYIVSIPMQKELRSNHFPYIPDICKKAVQIIVFPISVIFVRNLPCSSREIALTVGLLMGKVDLTQVLLGKYPKCSISLRILQILRKFNMLNHLFDVDQPIQTWEAGFDRLYSN